jgi:hypothetical protein
MTKSEGMTKHQIPSKSLGAGTNCSFPRQNMHDIRHSNLVIVSSFVIGHSPFSP